MEQRTATRTNGSGAQERPHGREPETQPADYALLNGVWLALITGLVAASRGRTSEDPIELRELVPLSAATFALSKAVARERIGSWVREPFVDEEHHRKPRGGHLRRAVGELVTCTRCVGTWSALGVVGKLFAMQDEDVIQDDDRAAMGWLINGLSHIVFRLGDARGHIAEAVPTLQG